MSGAKYRAKVNRVPFRINKEYIMSIWTDGCGYCGCIMEYHSTNGLRSRKHYSLDRINPKAGYVPGNVTFCCFHCNSTKGDKVYAVPATAADFTYIPESNMLVSEDSDLKGKWAHKSGITVDGTWWKVVHVEIDDGDLCWWDLIPKTPVEGANKMRIYND